MIAVTRVWLAVAVGLASLLARGPAVAAPAAGLSYARGMGAESCPDEAALRAAVVARLGEDPFGSAPAQSFRVEVVVAGEKLVGHVAFVDEAGTPSGLREFEATSCTELVQALALALSLAIKPDLPVGGPVASPEPEPLPPTSPKPPAPAAATARTHPTTLDSPEPAWSFPEAEDADRSKIRFAAGIFGAGGFGTAPVPVFGGGPMLRARYGRALLGLEGRFDLPTGRRIAAGGEVETSLLGAQIAPCWRFELADACGLALLGRFKGSVTGRDVPGSDGGFLAAAGVRAAFEQSLSSQLALQIRMDLLGLLTPLRLVRNQTTPVWSVSPVLASAGVGLVVEIP